MIYKTHSQIFNAVMACAATEDVRYYLNTFFIDIDNHRLVATNGHVMAIADIERTETGSVEPDRHRLLRGFLFQRLIRPISNIGEVHIDCGSRTLRYQSGRHIKQIELTPCDGVFPDYTRVAYASEQKAVSEIAFNTEYVAKPARWAGFDYCAARFSFNGNAGSMGITYIAKGPLANVRLTLMPARIA